MKVGDVVETKTVGYHGSPPRDWIGVIIEIIHQKTAFPDYRTPSMVRVCFPVNNAIELCYKNELKVINGVD